jgi:2-methylcitrate dehydratase PrpD
VPFFTQYQFNQQQLRQEKTMAKTTEAFAQFVADTRFEDIPPPVIDQAKKLMLDCIGIALAGSLDAAGKIIVELVKEMGGHPEASVIGAGFKTSVLNAALANGVMAHALDFDEGGHATLPLSRSVTVLPAVLALGELTGATGKDVLLGYIIGFDLISKVSDGMSNIHHYEWGWQTTGTVCTLGAAAGGAKILKLNKGETAMALGIAGSGAGGLRQNNGTMTKPLHAGNAARNGVLAALLAKKGFTATEEVFEGKFGFCQCFCGSEGYNLNKMTERLGKTYEFTTPGVAIKPYPACMSTHRSLDAIFSIIEKYKFTAEEVERIDCGVNRDTIDLLVYLHPQTALEGKFSLQYCIAVALLDGKAGLSQFTDERVRDPYILDLMKKIHVYEHPETKDQPKRDQFSEITVHLKNGQAYSSRAKLIRDRPKDPLDYDGIVPKYKECAGMVLPDASVELLLDMVKHMEDLDKISLMTNILRLKTTNPNKFKKEQ